MQQSSRGSRLNSPPVQISPNADVCCKALRRIATGHIGTASAYTHVHRSALYNWTPIAKQPLKHQDGRLWRR